MIIIITWWFCLPWRNLNRGGASSLLLEGRYLGIYWWPHLFWSLLSGSYEESPHFSKLPPLPRKQGTRTKPTFLASGYHHHQIVFNMADKALFRGNFTLLYLVFTLGNCLKQRYNTVNFVSLFLHLELCSLTFWLFIIRSVILHLKCVVPKVRHIFADNFLKIVSILSSVPSYRLLRLTTV